MKNMNKLYYLKQEIFELKSEIENITELSSPIMTGMPSSNSTSNPTEEYLIKKQRLIDKLVHRLEKYTDELTKIENIIDNLNDPEVRVIARLRFIENLKWEQIGRKVHLDRTVCYRKLKNTINQLEEKDEKRNKGLYR